MYMKFILYIDIQGPCPAPLPRTRPAACSAAAPADASPVTRCELSVLELRKACDSHVQVEKAEQDKQSAIIRAQGEVCCRAAQPDVRGAASPWDAASV